MAGGALQHKQRGTEAAKASEGWGYSGKQGGEHSERTSLAWQGQNRWEGPMGRKLRQHTLRLPPDAFLHCLRSRQQVPLPSRRSPSASLCCLCSLS